VADVIFKMAIHKQFTISFIQKSVAWWTSEMWRMFRPGHFLCFLWSDSKSGGNALWNAFET